jgi:hypothetical protein
MEVGWHTRDALVSLDHSLVLPAPAKIASTRSAFEFERPQMPLAMRLLCELNRSALLAKPLAGTKPASTN